MAKAAKEFDCFLDISLQIMYLAEIDTPYTEGIPVNPLGVYGQTKLNGEREVQNSGCKYLILRTSWLYSEFGNNFVKAMIRLTSEKESLKVVFDQVATPTYAGDLASFICSIIKGVI